MSGRRAAGLLVAVGALAGGGCGSGSTHSDGVSSVAPARPASSAGRATTSSARTPGSSSHRPRPAHRSHPPPAHPVPLAFRVAPGAPSDAEVRRELAEMLRIERRQQALQTLRSLFSPAAANAATLLPWSLEAKNGVQVSVASEFTDYGLGLACGGVLGVNQLGVAHKTAPCGTLITFYYGGRTLTVPVIDRGPYIAGREWDLTGAAAAELGFPGLGQVQWSLAS